MVIMTYPALHGRAPTARGISLHSLETRCFSFPTRPFFWRDENELSQLTLWRADFVAKGYATRRHPLAAATTASARLGRVPSVEHISTIGASTVRSHNKEHALSMLSMVAGTCGALSCRAPRRI